jgi:hypothetical protein
MGGPSFASGSAADARTLYELVADPSAPNHKNAVAALRAREYARGSAAILAIRTMRGLLPSMFDVGVGDVRREAATDAATATEDAASLDILRLVQRSMVSSVAKR